VEFLPLCASQVSHLAGEFANRKLWRAILAKMAESPRQYWGLPSRMSAGMAFRGKPNGTNTRSSAARLSSMTAN